MPRCSIIDRQDASIPSKPSQNPPHAISARHRREAMLAALRESTEMFWPMDHERPASTPKVDATPEVAKPRAAVVTRPADWQSDVPGATRNLRHPRFPADDFLPTMAAA